MDLLSCNWDSAKFLIFSQNVYDPLIYYSHLLPMISALLLGIFVFLQNKKKSINILFFLLTIVFSIWVYFDLILWATEKAQFSMFFWSALIYFEYAIFAISFFLIYYFLYKKHPSFKITIPFILFFIPIIIFGASEFNLISYDLSNCDRGVFEGALWTYMYIIEAIIIALSTIFSIFYFTKNKTNSHKKHESIFAIGTIAFMTIFFLGNLTLMSDIGWNYEQYKLFGMLLFLLILIFMIVRFKTFNIKIIGAQALVWIMVILIGAQFIFVRSNVNRILTSITFVTVSIMGLILIRSVKKVDIQRELLEKANNNQQSLLHFITHQVKGYMTKSRNIFDGMILGDYGTLDAKAKEMAQHGFDSDTRAVETVQAILRASDLKSGRIEFKKEKTNVSSLVAEVVDFRKEMAQTKNIELTFDIEPNIEILVDALQIKEVFKNLITNAILYTPKGEVHVVLRREKGHIYFAVIDTGLGLSDSDKERLFIEGGRGEESLATNIDSTGYGLFIAKKIVQKHQGKIGAHSEGRNKGSEFFVTLPDLK